jgi:circadian clock protein KaiC
VVDPISAILKASDMLSTLGVVQRLIRIAKQRGITFLCTSLLDAPSGDVEMSPIRVSTIADTWLHVAYLSQGGERNRSLSIIKSRGTSHSNQVRELLLSEHGPTLADVYTAGGEVLMGTLRHEKEREEQVKLNLQHAQIERKRRELALVEAEIAARMEVLKREVDQRRADLQILEDEYRMHQADSVQGIRETQSMRRADSQQRGETEPSHNDLEAGELSE